MLSQLHFQHPFWLLALLPLAFLLWQIKSRSDGAKSWANVIDKNLLPLLMQGEDRQAGKMIKWLLGLGWLLTVLALADPVWEKIPRPVFQTNSARVIVLDLSNSMLVNNLKPSRMARARFKVEDILSRQEEGQIGLVVFAGDAFTASPLTRDADTIRSLLKVLKPNLMPTQGSRADLGIEKAHELLTQANINNGQVLLITDGASDLKKAEQAAKALKKDGHTLSILAVGTETGGQLQLRGNQIVTVPLDINSLEKIAKIGGGVLHTITNNDNDLKAVLKTTISGKKVKQKKANDLKSSDWKSTGPYLVLLLLPFAALAFRKGWLLSVLLCTAVVVSLSPVESLMAAENEPASTTSTNNTGKSLSSNDSVLERLFENKEQRAAKALIQKQYDKASTLSKDPLRKGSAEYKKGNYEQALEFFKSSQGADARYNEGNALAKLKKYQEAIKAYEEALKEKPNMADALANKKALEDFLKKQKEQQKKNKQKKDSQKNKDNKNKQGQKNKDQKQSGKKDDKNKQNQNQKNQQKKGNKQQQDKNNKSGKDSKDGQQGKENKKGQQNKNKKNQFSEANKELDKKKKEKGDEKNQASQTKDQQAKGEQGKKKQDANKNKQSANSKANDKSKDKKGDDKKSKQQKTANKKQKDQAKKGQKTAENAKARAKAEELSKEEKMAAEQWLRRIPDDPGGLLRRKFRSQYQRRSRPFSNEKPW